MSINKSISVFVASLNDMDSLEKSNSLEIFTNPLIQVMKITSIFTVTVLCAIIIVIGVLTIRLRIFQLNDKQYKCSKFIIRSNIEACFLPKTKKKALNKRRISFATKETFQENRIKRRESKRRIKQYLSTPKNDRVVDVEAAGRKLAAEAKRLREKLFTVVDGKVTMTITDGTNDNQIIKGLVSTKLSKKLSESTGVSNGNCLISKKLSKKLSRKLSKVQATKQVTNKRPARPIPTCDTLLGSAALKLWSEGFHCPSDFLEQQRMKHGGVFKFPLVPLPVSSSDAKPIFVLDLNAMKQLKASKGFVRTNIAEEAVVSNLGLPFPKVSMEKAEHNAILFRVFRELVTRRSVEVRDALFEQVPKAFNEVLFGDVKSSITLTAHHADLFHVAARAMFLSMGGAILSEEYVRHPKTFDDFFAYGQSFPHIFVMEKLGLSWAAEKYRGPLYCSVERMNEIKRAYGS